MFETLTRDVATRFHLGDKAQRFIRALVDALFDEGGPAEVQRRFADAGLGQRFDSWIGSTPSDDALQPDQFVTGMGQARSERIASGLGVEPAIVNAAGAYALPKIIGLLTRQGALPTSRPADYERWFAAAPVAAAAPLAQPQRRDGGAWWKWLIPLLLLIAAILAFRSCRRDEAVAPAPRDTAAAAPAATVGMADPGFTFDSTGDGVRIDGRLASAADAERLRGAVAAVAGADGVTGDIRVDANTRPATWVNCIADAMPALRQDGLRFEVAGSRLVVESDRLPADQRFAATRALRTCYAGFETQGLWDRAAAALAGLKRPFTGEQLAGALNLMEIYFDTDSATITRDSYETLARAAEAIRELPAGTRIEVGGHTDTTGDAAHNMALSQQRADAVVAKLVELGVGQGVLTAKGYGQDKPKATNDTDEGRAQNRRIEFTVLK